LAPRKRNNGTVGGLTETPPADPQTAPSSSDNQAQNSTSIWRRVRHDIILLGAGNAGIVLAQLGFRSILLVALLPAAYGRLSLVLSIYNTILIISASGLPNATARHLALGNPADDRPIVRASIRAAFWPTIVASAIIAPVAGVLIQSPLACLLAAAGLSSLVYSVLTTGILRGRGRVAPAASIMPVAAFSEVGLLALLWFSGAGVTLLSAFGIFCIGNVVGLVAGITCTVWTKPHAAGVRPIARNVPSSRQLLGFSLWLSAATVGVSIMPLIMRLAATIDSYTMVAVIDIVLVLLSVPQRLGTVIVSAVVPHATRALEDEEVGITISPREHLVMVVPFVLAAGIAAFTPLVSWLFDSIGRPAYAGSGSYLALALLAGPARILYGLVEGVLVAHGEGRFLGLNAISITTVASALIILAAEMGSTAAAFAIFVIACWAVYLNGLRRIGKLANAKLLEPKIGMSEDTRSLTSPG
jgi:O-antigen/teichoic acid export membrane protein